MATRRERVILELDDQFTPGIIRAAAAARLAEREIDGLGGSSSRASVSGERLNATLTRNARGLDDLENRARAAERSGSLLTDTIFGLGPAFAPIGAVVVPAVAGLTAELGFAVAGAGSMVLAMHGLGDGLKALDAYQLDPTAANLERLNEAMNKLGPAGQAFVAQLDSMEPALNRLKVASEDGLLPGLGDGLDHLLTLLPQARRIISEVSGTTGGLLDDAGASIASGDFKDFFAYLERDARPILTDLGHTLGNVTRGFANLFVGFEPGEVAFSAFMARTAHEFEQWSAGLENSTGLQDFFSYVDETGPQLASTLGAITGAITSIVKAAAPLGGPTLAVLEDLANIVDNIASSGAGTPLIALASGLALVNRALATRDLARGSTLGKLLFQPEDSVSGIDRMRGKVRGFGSDLNTLFTTSSRGGANSARELERVTAAQDRMRTSLAGLSKGAAVVGGLALATSDLGDNFAISNTASLALMGTIAGPFGAAVGAGAGLLQDMSAAGGDLVDTFDRLDASVESNNIVTLTSNLAAAKQQMDSIADASGTGYLKSGLAFIDGLLHGDNIANNETNISKAQTQLGNLTSTYRALADAMGKRLPADASPQQIQDFANSVTPALQKAGISIEDLTNGSYAGLTRAAAAVKEYLSETQSVAGQTRTIEQTLTTTSLAADQLASSLQAVFSPKINASAAKDAFLQSLQQIRTQLKATAGLTGKSAGALDNREVVRGSVQNLTSQLSALADAGASSDRLVRVLQRGRDAILEQGAAAGIARPQLKRYLDQLGLTPSLIKTLIRLDGDDAAHKARQVKKALQDLDGLNAKAKISADPSDAYAKARELVRYINGLDPTLHIRTTGGSTAPGGGLPSNEPPRRKHAIGGRVSGDGGPTDDRIPAWLSDGEYVMRAAAVDRFGVGLFDRLNSFDQLGAMRSYDDLFTGFAAGGLARKKKRPKSAGIIESQYYSGAGSDELDYLNAVASAESDVADLIAQLNETKTIGKGKHKHTELVLTGLQRAAVEAQARLAIRRRDELKSAAGKAKYLTQQAGDVADTSAADAAAQAADTQQSYADQLFGSADLFSRGTSAFSAERYANRLLQDVTAYKSSLDMLVAAGAGSGVLKQVERIAETGDYRSAARAARQLANNPAVLGNVNSTLAATQALTSQISAVVNGAAFAAGNLGMQGTVGGVSAPVVNNFYTDPNWLLAQVQQVVTHTVQTQLAQAS